MYTAYVNTNRIQAFHVVFFVVVMMIVMMLCCWRCYLLNTSVLAWVLMSIQCNSINMSMRNFWHLWQTPFYCLLCKIYIILHEKLLSDSPVTLRHQKSIPGGEGPVCWWWRSSWVRFVNETVRMLISCIYWILSSFHKSKTLLLLCMGPDVSLANCSIWNNLLKLFCLKIIETQFSSDLLIILLTITTKSPITTNLIIYTLFEASHQLMTVEWM